MQQRNELIKRYLPFYVKYYLWQNTFAYWTHSTDAFKQLYCLRQLYTALLPLVDLVELLEKVLKLKFRIFEL